MVSDVPINASQISFTIIETVLKNGEIGVTEMADRLDKPTSTIHNHVNTLEKLDYLVSKNGKYSISSKFLFLGNKWRYSDDLFLVAKPELKNLARETGEYVLLVVQEEAFGIVLIFLRGEKAENRPISGSYPGMRTELHTTAPGKTIMSQLSEKEREQIINETGLISRTSQTITDQQELKEDLKDVSEQSYALDFEERISGMHGVGVPITIPSGNRSAGVGVYGPKNDFSENKLTGDLLDRIEEVVNTIEVRLRYS